MPEALEVSVHAPVASFRNPLYAGIQVGLPCPPPSTVGGLLASAAGGWEHVPLRTRFAMTFHAEGEGKDLETYHPDAAPGTPTNATIKEREFLAFTTLRIWLVEDLDLWQRAFRRPVWPLRLGRSQDLVRVDLRRVDLAAGSGVQGHALVPHDMAGAVGTQLRLTTVVSPERDRFGWDHYRYAKQGAPAILDSGLVTSEGQAVVLLPETHPGQFANGGATPAEANSRVLQGLWAKEPVRPAKVGEALSDHLLNTLRAAVAIRERVGTLPYLSDRSWTLVLLAALFHDAGKVAFGFQLMVGNGPGPRRNWGERHEVLSLGFVAILLADLPEDERLTVASLVAGHHRPFTTGGAHARKTPLFPLYEGDQPEEFLGKFTPLDEARVNDLVRWLRATCAAFELPVSDRPSRVTPGDVVTASHRLFQKLYERWSLAEETEEEGRATVLLLGATTMADHLSSGHHVLDTKHPLSADYPDRLAKRFLDEGKELRPQQAESAAQHDHLLLRSWTGSGKTEAALLWATTQIADISAGTGGTPRLFYLLPYLASINAMAGRLTEELEAAEHIGVAHSRAASYHLARALADDCADHTNDQDDRPDDLSEELVDDAPVRAAQKAHARAEATRNFRELLRVGTPYQLLRGALAGPIHSGILTDSANSVFVLDELHAYDERRLGMILAMLGFWADLGGRVAVMSATLPEALKQCVEEALATTLRVVEPPAELPAPRRHRLHTRSAHLTDATSIGEIRQRLAEGRSVLVVANNVRDAVTLYEELAPACHELHGEDSAFLLHSRFRRGDRNAIEGRIAERFGTRRPRRPGLLVGTQVLEVSLDLDLDVCHTSAANLEALLQRFGRVNRLGSRSPAPTVVHEPTYAPRRRGGGDLWADGVYSAEATQLAWSILTEHDGQVIDEGKTARWLDDIYASAWGERWRADVDHHRRAFTEAFLKFEHPFDDRGFLADQMDEMFEGTEAILLQDQDEYERRLNLDGSRGGRLLAADLLIPLPYWGRALSRWEKQHHVRTIDGDYDPTYGLRAVHRVEKSTYQPGALL
ncbi:CRISPR-associated helicase Cas3' [Streptomyces triticirhizae]|uniref:CRISPR-associated helicase Cas3' n=1 Tax=Streptomyces triticirhizae TaxID=2483353 RepID=UPI0018F38BE6|nr:CRISPR-associated helicase Cas3' [Streptomyces triticirhizae]